MIFVIICVLGISAIAIALFSEPIYRSEVEIMSADMSEEQGILGSLASGLGGWGGFLPGGILGGDDSREAAPILLSHSFTASFINDENLLPVLFPGKWDPEQGDWLDPQDVPSMNTAVSRFDRGIRSLKEDEWFGTLILTIEWHDAEMAARWANLMVERLNERLRSAAVLEAELSLQYLNEELEKATMLDLREAIYALAQDQINKIMLANIREEYAFKVIDPAVASDKDDFVRPRRILLISLGLIVGLSIGIFIALLLGAIDRARKQFLDRPEAAPASL